MARKRYKPEETVAKLRQVEPEVPRPRNATLVLAPVSSMKTRRSGANLA